MWKCVFWWEAIKRQSHVELATLCSSNEPPAEAFDNICNELSIDYLLYYANMCISTFISMQLSDHDVRPEITVTRGLKPECRLSGRAGLYYALQSWNGMALRYNSQDLIGAMWLMLAYEVTETYKCDPCANCGRMLRIASGIDNPNRIYCNDACKQQAYRKRKREGQISHDIQRISNFSLPNHRKSPEPFSTSDLQRHAEYYRKKKEEKRKTTRVPGKPLIRDGMAFSAAIQEIIANELISQGQLTVLVKEKEDMPEKVKYILAEIGERKYCIIWDASISASARLTILGMV